MKEALKIAIIKKRELEELLEEMNQTIILAKRERDDAKTKGAQSELEKANLQIKEELKAKVGQIHSLENSLNSEREEKERREKQMASLKEEIELMNTELENKEKEISLMKRDKYNLSLKLEEQQEIVR